MWISSRWQQPPKCRAGFGGLKSARKRCRGQWASTVLGALKCLQTGRTRLRKLFEGTRRAGCSRRASKLLGGDTRLRARVCWSGGASELLASEPWWYGVRRSRLGAESSRASFSEVPRKPLGKLSRKLLGKWSCKPLARKVVVQATRKCRCFCKHWSAGTLPRESGKCVAAILATLKIRFFILPARRPRLLLASLAAAASLATGKISV